MALKLKGSTSGFVAIDCAAEGGNNTLILPSDNGVAGAVWANNVETAGVATCTSITINKNGDLTVPGTVSIGGTLTYEDVTNVDVVGVVTAAQGVRINGGGLSIIGVTTGLNVSGVSTFAGNINPSASATYRLGAASQRWNDIYMANDMYILDDGRVCWGTGDDLTIAHNGTDSTIGNTNGQLEVACDNLRLRSVTGDKKYFTGSVGAASSIYHNDSVKLSTTSSGINISNDLKVVGLSTFSGVGQFGGNVEIASGTLHIGDEIAHYGDTDTNIGFPAADTFTVDTAGSERLRITGGGNVGIGTDIPVTWSGGINLSLAANNGGQLELKKLSSDIRHYIWGDDNLNVAAGYHNGGSSALRFFVNGNNERARITSAGLFGIGTNAPVNLLQVEGSAPVIAIRDTASHSAYSNGGKLYFQGKDSDGNVKTFGGILGVSQSSNNGQLRLQTRTGGTLYDRLTINATGAVGIATDNPKAQYLQVGLPKAQPGSVFTNSPLSVFSGTTLGGTIGDSQRLATFAGSGGTNVSGLSIYRYRRGTGTSWTTDGFDLRAEVDNTSSIYTYLNFAAGNTGVGGTTNPQQKLDVKGIMKLGATNSSNGWVQYTYTDNTYRLNYNGSGNDEVVMTTDGYFNIEYQPAFKATGTITFTDWGTYEYCTWSSEDFDSAGAWNGSTFTCPTGASGKYQFNVEFIGPASPDNGNANYMLFGWFVNSSGQNLWRQDWASGTNLMGPFSGIVVSLNAGDTVRVALHKSYGRPYASGYTSISGCKLA